MNTQTKQLRFWKELNKSNPNLFCGTPHKLAYFDIVNRDILPLKIRLDIYLNEEDYKEKGYLTLCVMFPNTKIKSIEQKLKGNNTRADSYDGRFFLVRTFDPSYLISDNPADWKNAKKWFTENTKAVLSILKRK